MVGSISHHEIPKTAEEVDFDRLVWDPVYRDAVRHLIEDARGDAQAPAGALADEQEKAGSAC